MSPRPILRVSRAVVFTTVCVTLATLGHAFASGAEVPAWAVLTGFAGTLLFTLALAGHERSLPTILGGLLGGQFALHSLFADASAPVADGHHAVAMPAHDSGMAMTLAHIAAAALSAWWLRRGERAIWALGRRLAARPARLLLPAAEPPALPPRVPVAREVAVPATDQVLRHLVVRRGPPLLSRAL
ncbi:hypothetical protein [Actinomadura hibisca]|uniref:hypothetical protein n=1 Tax=Actinomadura hibisca TaxID=68565 RepID=UPI0008336837|nr:hypothetical protein [Actinomadura hibisca]